MTKLSFSKNMFGYDLDVDKCIKKSPVTKPLYFLLVKEILLNQYYPCLFLKESFVYSLVYKECFPEPIVTFLLYTSQCVKEETELLCCQSEFGCDIMIHGCIMLHFKMASVWNLLDCACVCVWSADKGLLDHHHLMSMRASITYLVQSTDTFLAPIVTPVPSIIYRSLQKVTVLFLGQNRIDDVSVINEHIHMQLETNAFDTVNTCLVEKGYHYSTSTLQASFVYLMHYTDEYNRLFTASLLKIDHSLQEMTELFITHCVFAHVSMMYGHQRLHVKKPPIGEPVGFTYTSLAGKKLFHHYYSNSFLELYSLPSKEAHDYTWLPPFKTTDCPQDATELMFRVIVFYDGFAKNKQLSVKINFNCVYAWLTEKNFLGHSSPHSFSFLYLMPSTDACCTQQRPFVIPLLSICNCQKEVAKVLLTQNVFYLGLDMYAHRMLLHIIISSGVKPVDFSHAWLAKKKPLGSVS